MNICTNDLLYRRGQSEEKTRAQNAIKGAFEQSLKFVEGGGLWRRRFYSKFDAWAWDVERIMCPMRMRGCGKKTVVVAAEMLKSWGNKLKCPCDNKFCPLSKKWNEANEDSHA